MHRLDELKIGATAEVDYRTVRAAYRGDPRVRPAMRTVVRLAAEALGYPPPPAPQEARTT
jgi:DNA-binding LacI/PurR family transcriptional regulator